jgi:hypothetical protein
MREWIGVLTIHPNRPMQRRPTVGQPRLPHHFSRRNGCTDLHEDLGKERCRRLQAIPVVDCHRQHPGDAAGEGHDSGPARPDLAPESGGQIETPVPGIGASRLIHTHHPPRDGRLQAEGDSHFEKHKSTSPHAAPSTVSIRRRQENPFRSVRASDHDQ